MARSLTTGPSSVLVQSFTTPFRSFGNGNIQSFNIPGTYTFNIPSGIAAIRVRVWGAGGSGGAVSFSSDRYINAGAGGGYAEKVITYPDASYTITVGAGGASIGRNAGNDVAAGNAGGTSSFGSAVSATGGGGGTVSTGSPPAAAVGGVGSNGDVNFTGGSGGACTAQTQAPGGGSAAGPWGNGFAGGTGSGGTSYYLGGGGAGIGGRGGISSSNSVATGGGGSASAAVGFSLSGRDQYNNGLVGYNTVSSTSTVTGGTSTIPTFFVPRFIGEVIIGQGGPGAYTTTSAAGVTAGAGGNGAGGGGLSNRSTNGTACFAGAGGIFGGGGGCYGAGNAVTGGAGGIAAGGGAAYTQNANSNAAASGAGGDGLVIVEW